MDSNTAALALRTGDLEGILAAIAGDDAVEAEFPCPCGKANRVMIVRSGRTTLTWTDAERNHGATYAELNVVAHGSEAEAVEFLDKARADIMQVTGTGMAQLAAAMGGQVQGDFLVI